MPTRFYSLAGIFFFSVSFFALPLVCVVCEAALAKALSQFCTNEILTVQIEKIEIRWLVFEGC